MDFEIPHYEITKEIGEGGMAKVYQAIQHKTGRYFAIKIMKNSVQGNEVMLERFRREANLIARLDHLHILPLHDFSLEYEPPYIIMRYLDGGSLEDVLNKEELSLARSLRLMQQVAYALDYAHSEGVIHRDVKPSNILLDQHGNAYVTDFGIARRIPRVDRPQNNQETLTESGFAVGTPDYMSPEQGLGSEDVDHRTDIYSMGVLLFQMVTGERPYSALSAMEVIIKHIRDPIPSPRKLNPRLPSFLEEVIYRAMSKEREERYETAAAFARDLEDLEHMLNQGRTKAPIYIEPLETEQFEAPTPQKVTPPEPMRISPNADPIVADQLDYERVVTMLCVNANDYWLLVEQQQGAAAAHAALNTLWDSSSTLIKNMGGQVVIRDTTYLVAMWSIQFAQRRDPEYALSTALQMHHLLRQVGVKYLFPAQSNTPLPLKIGVNIGRVLMLPNKNYQGFESLKGDALTFAYVLTEQAEGTILVSNEIFRLTRNSYEFAGGPPITVRGQNTPVQSFRVRDVLRRNTGTLHPSAQSPQNISAHELQALVEAYEIAIYNHQTRIMTVKARSQLAKSRLLEHFFSWVAGQNDKPFILRGFSIAPEMRIYPYTLIRDMLEDRFDITPNDPPATIHQKIEDGVSSLVPVRSRAVAHFLGNMLGYDFSNSPHVVSLRNDTNKLNQFGRESFIYLITELTKQYPIIMHLEDVQWADTESVRLINELTALYPNLPLLILCRLAEKDASVEDSIAHRQRRPSRVMDQFPNPEDEETNINFVEDEDG